MKISKERLRQIILEEIQGLFEWPRFKGGGAPPEDDQGIIPQPSPKRDEDEEDLKEMEYWKRDEKGHPDQSCEEAHADCDHEDYIAGQC